MRAIRPGVATLRSAITSISRVRRNTQGRSHANAHLCLCRLNWRARRFCAAAGDRCQRIADTGGNCEKRSRPMYRPHQPAPVRLHIPQSPGIWQRHFGIRSHGCVRGLLVRCVERFWRLGQCPPPAVFYFTRATVFPFYGVGARYTVSGFSRLRSRPWDSYYRDRPGMGIAIAGTVGPGYAPRRPAAPAPRVQKWRPTARV